MSTSRFTSRTSIKPACIPPALGFDAPAITTELRPMSGAMPNIITLPSGKSPPLHVQALSWRRLLKLMARLSGTRIEPTLEAVAAMNGELKLRTVIQFIKVSRLPLLFLQKRLILDVAVTPLGSRMALVIVPNDRLSCSCQLLKRWEVHKWGCLHITVFVHILKPTKAPS